MKTTSSNPVSVAEAKEMINKRIKDGELNYEQTLAIEHAEKFANGTSKALKKKAEDIVKKNEKVPMETAVKIVDIAPKTLSTIKAIMLKDKVELTDEELAEILKLIG